VLRLLLASGMRWSECARAQASDLQGGKLVLGETKSGDVRRVPSPAAVLAECRGRVGRICPFTDSVSFNKRVRDPNHSR
jgi:integrase